MLALAGYPLGLSFRIFDAASEAPAGQLGELIPASLDDPASLEPYLADLAGLTFEGEDVPLATVRALASRLRVFPPPAALEVAQDRVAEKEFFTRLGIPTPPYAAVSSREALDAAVARIGLPAVLKTRRRSHDGKGGVVVPGGGTGSQGTHARHRSDREGTRPATGPTGRAPSPATGPRGWGMGGPASGRAGGEVLLRELADVERTWAELRDQPLILEAFVPFQREVSLIAARNLHGETAIYPLVENHHAAGVLSHSRALGPGLASLQQTEAEAYMVRVLSTLRYVGVVTIEFFQIYDRLLASEITPRVHNSGHWTIEGAETSQFENHLRAGLGQPLGSPAATGYCGMANLIGEIPDPGAILRVRGAHLHLYGESPRPGRKLGHVTIRADDAKSLEARMAHLGQILKRNLV
jgi:5-(carboxyamino)imidazole ribonucleotide synthase